MPVRTIQTKRAPDPIAPYSQGVIAGGFLFTAGQIPLDPTTMTVVQGDAAAQTERVMSNLGAEVVLTPGILLADAVERAAQIARERVGAVLLDQFTNPANPREHRLTTALEIWEDTKGAVDVFVAGVGMGGTITGVGEGLLERKPTVKVIAVEPAKAAVLLGQSPQQHGIPGIGVGFVPKVLNRAILHEIIPVSDENAISTAQRLARDEGIVGGISSGAALHAALQIASRRALEGKLIVVLLADGGERYLGTQLFI